MYRRILLIVSLVLLTTACAPYYGGQGYYRTEVYSADRYGYPGYYRPAYPNNYYNRGYYVVPPQPRYYAPAPRYYRPAPGPYYKPYPGRGYDSRYHRQGPSRGNQDRNRDGWPDRNWHR